MNYYNELDGGAAAWLRELIADGLIPAGEVDERSICDVRGRELDGFGQCHFFAGIGGWPDALRLAGWPEEREVWTGSCPCPPFSCAGKKKCCPSCESEALIPHPHKTGVFACAECEHQWYADGRHLWPEMLRLVRQCSPAVVFGEQVASEDGLFWLAGVRATLEGCGYAVGAADLPAAGLGAPHIRQRLWWVADAEATERRRVAHPCECGPQAQTGGCGGLGGFWSDYLWLPCADGKSRRVGIRPSAVADGIPGGMDASGQAGLAQVETIEILTTHEEGRAMLLKGYGNAIVPEVAAVFIRACMGVGNE